MKSSEVRKIFLEYFQSKEHKIVPSAPMVIKNDPSLMFTNAGMNQFKDIFLGHASAKYLRIANTQKCLRVSGKHNDLEEVGHDTYHHTMFEMLGNWSFGDYFKKEAIDWAWELLTKVFQIPSDDLYVTAFGGDEADKLPEDSEAFGYWKSHVEAGRILAGSRKDNFWEMGESGPCGPCSEIHFDLRSSEEKQKMPGRELINKGHPLVIEIWNLVFIEFNRQSDGTLVALPQKHIDTGMGFERLCMVIQGKKSNYDTDIFQPVISEISKISGIEYGNDGMKDVAMRVVADHLRAIAFAIADGQLPSNTGAGYVIRRILRRAVRYGFTFLGLKEPFIHELLKILVAEMGPFFPELNAQQDLIRKVVAEEEQSFLRTLSQGIKRFEQYVADNKDRKTIDGNFAFELFDTYGFPVDLTQLMAHENGRNVDMEGFQQGLEAQKNRSRKAAQVDTQDWIAVHSGSEDTAFVGFENLEATVKIIKFRKVKAKGQEFFEIVLDKTPFYAEAGGQAGDRGMLIADGQYLQVEDTYKEHELIIHRTSEMLSNPGAEVKALVDGHKRRATANNHSATHLMHAALRSVLGKHVEQKGSLVDENHLRFDFSHYTKMTNDEIREVERLVNARIRENILLTELRHVPIDEAISMGAMALFGEKYGEQVRVIIFDKDYSVELCGGTHVPATGNIGFFKIISESAIAAGIRRIEAVTGDKAEEYIIEKEDLISEVQDILKNAKDLVRGVKNLVDENKALQKKLEDLNKYRLTALKSDLMNKGRLINGIFFIAEEIDIDAKSAKDLVFSMKNDHPGLFLLLITQAEGKVGLNLLLSDDLVKSKNLNAGMIIREFSAAVSGGGGGQPSYASAGGSNPKGIPDLMRKAEEFVKKLG